MSGIKWVNTIKFATEAGALTNLSTQIVNHVVWDFLNALQLLPHEICVLR